MRRRNVTIIAIVSVAVVAFVAVVVVRIATNPVRRSNAEIRKWALTKTPRGTKSNEVWSVAYRQGWELISPTKVNPQTNIVGKLGSYQGFPFYTYVYGSWDFDASNSLENIRISRICDGP
jgi:hypothetical protein